MKGILSDPPQEEEVRQVEKLIFTFWAEGFKGDTNNKLNEIKERWDQLAEAARLYEHWTSKSKTDQVRVFVEVFKNYCEDNPSSDHSSLLQITDPREEISEKNSWSSFSWVLKRSKEELQQTLINGIPILHWALIHRKDNLLVKLISRGFTIDDIRELEETFLHHQIQNIEKGKGSFPITKVYKNVVPQMKFFLENPPEEAQLENAKRMASIFGVEFLKVVPHIFEIAKKFLERIPAPRGLGVEEEQRPGAESENPTYTITDPTGETTKIGKFPRRTEIGTPGVKCEWDSAFNWVLEKSKEELMQTLVDGIPILPWAVIHDEKTLIAKLINRRFSREDLEKVEGNLLQYRVRNMECEYQSEISLLNEYERFTYFIELAKGLILNSPEENEIEQVSRTAGLFSAIIFKGIAHAFLQKSQRKWEQLTEIARIYSP